MFDTEARTALAAAMNRINLTDFASTSRVVNLDEVRDLVVRSFAAGSRDIGGCSLVNYGAKDIL